MANFTLFIIALLKSIAGILFLPHSHYYIFHQSCTLKQTKTVLIKIYLVYSYLFNFSDLIFMKSKESMHRNNIMRSAIVHFSNYHYKSVKVNSIARASQIPTSLLYYYYENKESILLESYSYLINDRCVSIGDLNFKKLVIILTSIFLDHKKYSTSIHYVLSKNPDFRHELEDIIYSYFSLCRDIKKEDYESYRVVLISLMAHPGIMFSLNETNITHDALIAAYNKILA